jgi:hypothetical protein
MFLSSSACAFVETEKQFHSSSSEMRNPQFVEHCRKLLLLSLLPEQPSFGLFQELQNTVACQCCRKESFFVFDSIEKERKREKTEKTQKTEKTEKTEKSESEGEGSGECEGECGSEYYCVICYVDRFCNVHTFQNHDGTEHYIFKEKGSGGKILYQSSSIIQRLTCSTSA